jgi:hypothetical protein
VLHPVENTFILRLSCLNMFTKLNSNRDATIFFESIPWALFLRKFVAEMFFFWITSLEQNFCKVPQYEKLKKNLHVQDFLEFLKGSFRVEHPKLDQMEPFTVSSLTYY